MVVLSLIVSIALQVVWLRQLFMQQRAQAKQEIEQLVSDAAKENTYKAFIGENTTDTLLGRFFLTPEWVQMRAGFDAVRVPNISKSLSADTEKDSATLEMKITFFTHKKPYKGKVRRSLPHSDEVSARMDSISLDSMHTTVSRRLANIGLRPPFKYVLSVYPSPDTLSGNMKNGVYKTKKYLYNMEHLHEYQLLVTTVDSFVWYRMRYYLLSSLLMVILTGAAFYFIIRLMHNQRLYADARVAFTSNMTHELKTPIATVALALESITKYDLIHQPEKLEDYLAIGRQELQRLNLMIEKVLNLSHEGDSAYQLNMALFDVQANLQEVIRSLELQLNNAGAVCRFLPSPEPCFVYGDAVHLTNVFYNLIDNAIKYAVEPLLLEITCISAGDKVIIHFKDNGPGIEKIYQDKIFDRFFRIPKGDTHNVRGSGLGLNYVKYIVERHNGAIALKSEPGKGSDFIINLPAAT